MGLLPIDICVLPAPDAASLDTSTFIETLDDAERSRFARFHDHRDASLFAIRRTFLRAIVSHHIGIPPRRLLFDRRCERCGGDHGKPRLVAGPGRGIAVRFSMTQSAWLTAVAIGGADLGLDVEYVREDSLWEEVAVVALSIAERDDVMSFPLPERPRAFFQQWVRKEALSKLSGVGLTIPLSAIRGRAPTGEPRTVEDGNGATALASRAGAHLLDLCLDGSFVGALASEVPVAPRVRRAVFEGSEIILTS